MTKGITIYSKENCMQCTFTKNYLKGKGISFQVKDVEADPAAKDEVVALGFATLPVIVAEGFETFHGFRPQLLNQFA